MANEKKKLIDDDRRSRDQETYEADEMHESYEGAWESPQILDTKKIPARKGFVQRWVRTKIKAEDDQTNVFKKINQGWKPRLISSVPKGSFIPHIDFNGTDVIGIHGQILMERPEAIHKKQAAHNRNATRIQMDAVKHDVHKVHEIGSGLTRPEISISSKVSRGVTVDD